MAEHVSDRHFTLPNITAVRAQAAGIDGRDVVDRAAVGQSLSPPAALALFRDQRVPTEVIQRVAEALVAERRPKLHTFVPLYTTNLCGSDCKMCGMRKSNTTMIRKFAGKQEIEEQLAILHDEEGVRGVGFLTGEYSDEYTRLSNAFRIGWAIRTAFDYDFERIYFNIGSMSVQEIDVLTEWVHPDEAVTMCVFQETYDRNTYASFMGTDEGNPKADYNRRISTLDRWLDAGHNYVNPGVLVGLHDIESELVALLSHVRHLADRGGVVDISLPRLRPALAFSNKTKVGDTEYIRLISVIALSCRDQRIVLTNREDRAIREQVLDLCGVISPGSPDVSPYRRGGSLINEEASSQFLVADLSRPSDILGRIVDSGREVALFNPDRIARSCRRARRV